MPIRRRCSIRSRLSVLPCGTLRAVVTVVCVLIAVPGCSGPKVYTTAHLPEDFRAIVPAPGEPAESPPLTPNPEIVEVIESGDVLEVTIAAGLAAEDIVTIPSRVNDQGCLTLPEIGPVFVRGLGLPEAESAIRQAGMVQSLYRDPLVTLVKKTSRPPLVTVLGAVVRAGTYPLPSGSRDILAAIDAAGGLTEEASGKVDVTLSEMHDQADQDRSVPAEDFAESNPPRSPKTFHIQLAEHEAGDIPNQPLPHGAVVWVEPRAKASVQVTGLVEHPGLVEFSLEEDFRLLDALGKAEGVENCSANRAVIERLQSGQDAPRFILVDLRQARQEPSDNPRLMPGDIIHVEEPALSPVWRFLKGLPWSLDTN